MSSLPGEKAQSNTPSKKIMGLNVNIVVTIIIVLPIIFTIIAYPTSFSLSWNEGRGGFLFAMAFIFAELVGLNYPVSKKKLVILVFLSALTISYFVALGWGLRDWISGTGVRNNVQLVDSWVWMWDFVIMAAHIGLSLSILFGKKWYKLAPAGAIYLAGSAMILSLDAFFPYDSLGPLQAIVPAYLQIDQTVIRFVDGHILDIGPYNVATARGNLLVLNGLHGPFALQVFWPSAGVHSMIIYSLVMFAFLLKMEIPFRRKLVYFAIGTFGTVSINIIRIIALSLYALIVTTNVGEWEAFHSVAGEIMFLPWLGIYLALVLFIEGKRSRLEKAMLENSKS